jgi:hypothetical protein
MCFSDTLKVSIPASDRIEIPYAFRLPAMEGGYLLETFFIEEGKKETHMSRRYIKVGDKDIYSFYDPTVGY